MKWKQSLQGIMAAIGLFVLIFDSKLALEGARSGIDLCIKTVIPSLFPFFVISMVLTNALAGNSFHLIQRLAGLLGIPKAAASVLISGTLGGYPVGAKCVADLHQNKQITRKAAERLLAFSSNAGPSFLFGMVGAFFPERKTVWLLWLIHISSAVLTSAVIPAEKTDMPKLQQLRKTEERSVILSAAKAMALVCCWVILFRTIVTFLNAWFLWIFPAWTRVLLTGILELTNGCCELLLIGDVKLRFVLCSCMLAFGGICVLFQTASVIHDLSLSSYLKGKLIQTAFSILLSCAAIAEHGLLFAALIPILVMILRKIENRYGKPRMFPV